jgi:Tir chaperone protein (CesT) family
MKDGFERLIREFGDVAGIQGIDFDENGLCCLEFEEAYNVTMRRDVVRHGITLVGVVAEAIPSGITREDFSEMLVFSLGALSDGGSGLGLDPGAGRLLLFCHLSLGNLDIPRLTQALSEFVSLQEYWNKRLRC